MPHADPHEPDRRVDALIDYIEGDGDPDLAAWAVEALAGGLGVDALLIRGEGRRDRARALGEAVGSRLALAADEGAGDVEALFDSFINGLRAGLRG